MRIEDREGEYIRIRVILLGETASQVNIHDTFNDVDFYCITQKNDIDVNHIESYISDADIVLLLANGDDTFAVEHIFTITDLLNRNKKLYVKIIANEKAFSTSNNKSRDILTSSLLIVENQADPTLKIEVDTVRKIETILNTLCQVIDNKINTYRMHEYDCSALIILKSFFEEKGELFIYKYNTYDEFQFSVKNDVNLQIYLEKSSQIWLKFNTIETFSQEILNYIELIEENIDEDADLYFDSSYSMKKNQATILLRLNILLRKKIIYAKKYP